MKPELSERLFVESLFNRSIECGAVSNNKISEVEKLTGDASTRRYYRVSCGSEKYVVCLGNPIDEKSEKSEFIHIQKVLSLHNVRVPDIYDQNLSKGYILQEDLGNQTLLKKLAECDSPDEELDIYKRVIDSLIKMHSINVNDYKNESFSTLKFDSEKLMAEVSFATEHFIKGLMRYSIGREEEKILETEFKLICDEIAKEEMVFTHRDFHSRNIMVKNNDLIIIDFQDARMGIPQYDLASLLDDCYYQIPRSTRFDLMKYFWNQSPWLTTTQGNFDNFSRLYDLMVIQRTFKALGSFGYIYGQRNDERYLKYIGFGFEKLKDVLSKEARFKSLRKTLMKIYYEY